MTFGFLSARMFALDGLLRSPLAGSFISPAVAFPSWISSGRLGAPVGLRNPFWDRAKPLWLKRMRLWGLFEIIEGLLYQEKYFPVCRFAYGT